MLVVEGGTSRLVEVDRTGRSQKEIRLVTAPSVTTQTSTAAREGGERSLFRLLQGGERSLEWTATASCSAPSRSRGSP